ncbi:MAG: PorV/PorQ family protein [candidate division KSB1 bacterium]|nr:PorV/PorQ family protein [candidate division KSB1 bacterium]MDZ7301744.1 PorV/PorQ family protein [candidate division KSB1 bacterium]MDZ7311477.1 PorV/PorQ family protein [candidate division KSB1 bacterium]
MKSTTKRVPPIPVVLLAVCFLLFAFCPSPAQDAGKSGLAFLKVGVGSRGAALGEAYSALADEPTAIYWNPAGLAALKGTHLTFTHLSWLESINHEFAAVTFPSFGGTMGAGLIMQTIPGIQVRTKPTAEPIGTFDAQDLAFMLAFGRQWRSTLAAGFSAKFLYEKIYLNSATGFAIDLGGIWQTPVEHLKFGVSVQNLGAMSALQKDNIKLPALVRLGAAYVLPFSEGENRLALTAEHLRLLRGGDGSSAGAEFLFHETLALRAGYQFGRENHSLTAGFGTALGRYQLDYGYAPFGNDLGNAHRFSVEVKL